MDKKTIVATRELNHGNAFVAQGEELQCSESDASYYVGRHMATYRTRELSAQAPPPPPSAAPPVRTPARGPRPAAARVAPTPVAPMSTASAPGLVKTVEAVRAEHPIDADSSPNDDAPEERKASEAHSAPNWPPLA